MPRRIDGFGLPASLTFGGALLAALVAVAIAAPWLAPYPFDGMDVMAIREPPSAAHWFGTDEFGRDVLSRVLAGGRTSLFLGATATAVSLALGIPLGLLAGYLRGRVHETMMRLIDVLMSVPPILMGLLILSSTKPDVLKTAIAVGIIYVPIMTRLVRSVALDLSQEEFVLAARGRGERLPWILLREILPNAWPAIIVEGALRMTFAVMLASALSFLGLGVQPPSSDWGLMIAEARPFIDSAPWIALAPGLALCLTVVAINLMGDGLRDLLDPRMRERAR